MPSLSSLAQGLKGAPSAVRSFFGPSEKTLLTKLIQDPSGNAMRQVLGSGSRVTPLRQPVLEGLARKIHQAGLLPAHAGPMRNESGEVVSRGFRSFFDGGGVQGVPGRPAGPANPAAAAATAAQQTASPYTSAARTPRAGALINAQTPAANPTFEGLTAKQQREAIHDWLLHGSKGRSQFQPVADDVVRAVMPDVAALDDEAFKGVLGAVKASPVSPRAMALLAAGQGAGLAAGGVYGMKFLNGPSKPQEQAQLDQVEQLLLDLDKQRTSPTVDSTVDFMNTRAR